MPGKLTTVATYATPIEAEMARNRLEAAGIRVFVADENTIGWLWHLGTALQGIKIQVAEADVARAIEVLEDVQRPAPDVELPPWPCPNCGTEIEGNLEVCWACGTTSDGAGDPEFRSADALPARTTTAESHAKDPPDPILAILIALFIPAVVFNGMVGIDAFTQAASSPASAGWVLLLIACELLVVVGFFQWIYYPPPPSVEDLLIEREPAAADADLPPEDVLAPEVSDLTAAARRACLAAVLGMAFCPPLLNCYSVWLIVKHELYRDAFRRKSGWLFWSTMAVNAAVFLFVLLVLTAYGGLRIR